MLYAVEAIAVGFALFGVWAIWKPEACVALFGNEVQGRDGRNEARAVYGGLGIGATVVLFYAAMNEAHREGILLCAAAAVGGLALGRFISTIWDRGISARLATLAGIEIVCATIFLSAI